MIFSGRLARHHERNILSAEAEGIRDGVGDARIARLAPHERLSLAPPAPALQPEVEATKTVIDWVFEIKHSVNRAVASSLSKRDLDVLFGHLGQHIANWERKVAERDQGMLRAESSGAA